MNEFGMPSYEITGTPSGGQQATVTINSNTPDDFGSYWFLDGDVQGWDSPDMRVTMLTKIGDDVDAEGELPADLHYRGRSLVMKLYCEATSETNRENSRLLLAQAANTSAVSFIANEAVPKQLLSVVRTGNQNQGKLTIAEKMYPKKAAGSVPGVTTGVPMGLPVGEVVYLFEATVELYAADPWKYAVTPEFQNFVSGTINVSNPGSYPTMNAQFNITDTGTANGTNGPLNLSTNERALQLIVPTVPVGAPVLPKIPGSMTINLYDKTIVDNLGNNIYYLRNMQFPWLRIPTAPFTLVSSPHVQGSLTYYPAWI